LKEKRLAGTRGVTEWKHGGEGDVVISFGGLFSSKQAGIYDQEGDHDFHC
jgi:hypothetical protein